MSPTKPIQGAAILVPLLAVAAWIALSRAPGDRPASGDGASAPATAPAAHGAVAEPLPAADASARTSAAFAPGGAFGWTGVVLGPDGAPLAGARVRAELDGRNAETGSDEQGRFLLRWPREAASPDRGPYASWGGLAHTDVEPILPAEPPAEIVLRLAGGTAVRVLVVDRAAQPVAGVDVSFSQDTAGWIAEGVTGEDGRTTLQTPAEGFCWVLLGDLWSESAESITSLLVQEGEPPPELRFVIDRPSLDPVELLVVDVRTGLPVPDATFTRLPTGPLNGPASAPSLELAGPGYFRWDGPLAERPLALRIEAPGYASKQVVAYGSARGPERVPLGAIGDAIVHVLRRGEPAAGIRLEWVCESARQVVPDDKSSPFPFDDLRGEVVTDATGWAVLPLSLDEGTEPAGTLIELEAREDGRSLRRWQIRMPFARFALPWTLELEPPTARVRVRLSDSSGRPLPAREVILDVDPTEDAAPGVPLVALEAAGRIATLRTGAGGVAEAELFAPGLLHWTVPCGSVDRTWATLDEPLLPGETRELDLVVPRKGELAIEGRLVEEDGGPPRATWSLTLEVKAIPPERLPARWWIPLGLDERPAATASPLPDGGFRLDGLAEGEYLIEARMGAILASARARAGARDVVLTLEPRREVFVRVRDGASGAGLAGADVTLTDRTASYQFGSFTGADGGAAFEGMPCSLDQLLVHAEGFAPVQWSLEGTSEQDLRRLVVELGRARQLRIRLVVAGGGWQEVADFVRADWEWRGSRGEYVRWADEPRTLLVHDAPTAAFPLQAIDRDGRPLGPPLHVPAGTEDAPLELPWPP